MSLLLLLSGSSGGAPTPSDPPAIASNTTSLGSGPVNKPSGTATGDLLLIQVRDYLNQTLTAPSGFTSVIAFTNDIRHMIFYRVADGTEGVSFTVGGASGLTEIACTRITGASTVSPINASARTAESMVGPSITSTVDNCLILSFNAKGKSGGITKPASMTTQYTLQYYYDDGESVYEMWQGLAYETQATAGATGTKTWTTGNPGDIRYSTYTIAIAPV